MNEQDVLDLFIANTLYGGYPDDGWGLQFPPWAVKGDRINLALAERIRISQRNLNRDGSPFRLNQGWDWMPIGEAWQEICEILAGLPEGDEYGDEYRKDSYTAVARWIREVGGLEASAWQVVDGFLESRDPRQPILTALAHRAARTTGQSDPALKREP